MPVQRLLDLLRRARGGTAAAPSGGSFDYDPGILPERTAYVGAGVWSVKWCLCKEDCDSVSVLTWNWVHLYEDVRLCQCCGGERRIPYSYNVNRCPNRPRRE